MKKPSVYLWAILVIASLYTSCKKESAQTGTIQRYENHAVTTDQVQPSPMQDAEEELLKEYAAPAERKSAKVSSGLSAHDKDTYGGIYQIPGPSAPKTKMEAPEGQPITYDKAHNTEGYATIQENEFLAAKENPLSTFSIDVDGASYSNTRRYIQNGSLPPMDAVRVEEFINYFDYRYPEPQTEHPFAFDTEIVSCPWNEQNLLVKIGLQGKRYAWDKIAPLNLVFLIDVSGSMEDSQKLPLLKKAFTLLVQKLRPADRVALVVYAGAAGVVLPSTSGDHKAEILQALDRLQAGGSTAGGEGIRLAYQIAIQNKTENSINRVILATDGDFNVGASSDAEMTRLLEEKRNEGVYLTALGFGMGNYKDSKMETMADNGNGNYFYIDNLDEARKVLVTQLDGTLVTIAKDVKLQIEFNPAKVKGYRLIGYENRALKKEDFNNDKKDAGELGAGHTVTALYEIIPADAKTTLPSVDPLKYSQPVKTNATVSEDWFTVKFRYKRPNESKSILLEKAHVAKPKTWENASENLRFAGSVASFGMILRQSAFKGNTSFAQVQNWAQTAKGADVEGYRSEFIQLVKKAELIQGLAQK